MIWKVSGDIPSIKNTLRRAKSGHFYHVNDSVAVYKRIFDLQTPKRFKVGIDGYVSVKVTLVRANKRKDPLNCIDTVADCLENSGVIKNDRQIVCWEISAKEVNAKDPYVIIEVEEI